MTQEEKYMREAMRQAKKAAALKEVPIGCVIVHDGAIIARGYNRRTIDKNVLAHAEIIAIRKACRKIGDWRLEDCTMYVTLEPCPMCAGAIVRGQDPPGGHRLHESKGRMRRFCSGHAPRGRLQPPGRGGDRSAGRGVLPDDEGLLQGAERGRKAEKSGENRRNKGGQPCW